MTVGQLLSRLRSMDVHLWADGDSLRYSAPTGALTPDLRKELRSRKAEILTALRDRHSLNDDARRARPGGQGDLPLSFEQERLWRLASVRPGHTFNLQFAVPFPPAVVPEVMERSLNEVVRRHDSLRTSFSLIDGRPRQSVAEAATAPFRFFDQQETQPPRREAAIRRVAREEYFRPFDLAVPPLARAVLLRADSTDSVLVVTTHHLVSDGWSAAIFAREVRMLYDAFAHGRPSPLEELQWQYGDYAVWEREQLQDQTVEAHREWWRARLSDFQPLVLPNVRRRQGRRTDRTAHRCVVVPAGVGERLRLLARDLRATLFMVVAAGFGAAMSRAARQEQLIVGSLTAGRHRPETEPLIGYFVNPLPLPIDCSDDPSFKELIERVRRFAVEALARQDVPFSTVVEEPTVEGSDPLSPLFPVVIHMIPPVNGQRPPVEQLEHEGEVAVFDLLVTVADNPSGLLLTATYNSALFGASAIAGLLDGVQSLLSEAAALPDTPLSHLTVAGLAPRNHLWHKPPNPKGPAASADSPGSEAQSTMEKTPPTTNDATAAPFLAQDSLPAELLPICLDDLSPFHRALVLTDGTVTTLIQALTMEPVTVELLSQKAVVLDEPNRWLEIEPGEVVVARTVILLGRMTGNAYAHASSVLVPERLPEGFMAALDVNPGGLGSALVATRLENRRELLWFGAGVDRSRVDGAVQRHVTRSYRVIARSRAVLLVQERLPLDDHAPTSMMGIGSSRWRYPLSGNDVGARARTPGAS